MDGAEKPLAGTRVLLVEDEPLIAMDLASQLSDAGAVIVNRCATVSQAMEHLENSSIDVAVIDFVLEDRNSEPLQIALEGKGVPFVVVTAYPSVLVRRRVGQRILHKPVSPDLLRTTVMEVCGRT